MADKPKVIEADPNKVPIGHGLFACHLLDAMNVMRIVEDVMLQDEPSEKEKGVIEKTTYLMDSFEACLHNAGGAYLQNKEEDEEL